jgi:hypothetical protein
MFGFFVFVWCFVELLVCSLIIKFDSTHTSLTDRVWPDRLDYSRTDPFLCFAKEREQRKATTLPLPFGFPIAQDKKWESFETRYAQTTKFSLSICCPAQLAVSVVDESQKQQKQKQKQKQKHNQYQ